MDLEFEQKLAAFHKEMDSKESYKIIMGFDCWDVADKLFQAKYLGPRKDNGDGTVSCKALLGFYPGAGLDDPDHFYEPGDEDVSDRCIKSDIVAYMHENGIGITMERIELVLLCLQAIVSHA